MDKLKRCPFCGAQPVWCGDDPDDKHTCCQIRCNGCGFQIDTNNDIARSGETIEGERKLMAITWNTRVE